MRYIWLVLLILTLSSCQPYDSQVNRKAVQPDELTAKLTVSPKTGKDPLTVKLSAAVTSSTDAVLTGWTWTFGDGIDCTGTPKNINFCPLSIAHIFSAAKTYDISFRATDATGAVANATTIVTTTGPPPPVACVGGPPDYKCSNRSTSPIGTLTPLFSAKTPFNTVVYSPLNPTRNPITRFTDQNIVQYGTKNDLAMAISTANLTISGSDNDLDTSLHTKYVLIRQEGGPSWIFQTSINAKGEMQNATNGGENPVLGVGARAFSFSRISENVYYYLSGNYLEQATIDSNGTTMTSAITNNKNFPFNVDDCPGAPSGTPVWFSSLTVAAGDAVFMFSADWLNGQGYGHLVFAYSPTLGCSTLDLAPNETSSTYGNWYTWCKSNCSAAKPSGKELTCFDPYYKTQHGIHDVFSSVDGTMENIEGGCWNGQSGEAPAYWQVNSGNVQTSSPQNPPKGQLAGGHVSIGYKHALFTNAPTPNTRLISPLTKVNLEHFTNMVTLPQGASGPGGLHGGWPSGTSDQNYWLIESACSPAGYLCGDYLHPNYLQNEIFGIDPYSATAAIVRFAPTYNSGTSPSFGCGMGIGFPSQDGQWWFWLADGLLKLGLDPKGHPLCSVFAVHLDLPGQ